MAVDGQLKMLKCVSDETRLKILHALKDRERCVCEIMGGLGREQSLVSHHLQEMRKCGLVVKRREGKKIMYKLADKSILKMLTDIDRLSEKFCLAD